MSSGVPEATPTALRQRLSSFGQDSAGALQWLLATVPASIGFWVVAGDLAGVAPDSRPTLVGAALLAMGITSLIQLWLGHRLTVFEGPSGTYLAAIVVVAGTNGVVAKEVTGGLLLAGAFVIVLTLLRIDRRLGPLFTPTVSTCFLVIVAATVLPPTIERALAVVSDHPWGTLAGWAGLCVVVFVGVGFRYLRHMRTLALLFALLIGTVAYRLIDGSPDSSVVVSGGGLEILPWGAPRLTATVIMPFLVAGLLSSINAIASVKIMESSTAVPDEGTQRRALLVHGVGLLWNAMSGSLLGNVPRLDSVGVVALIGNRRRAALGLAAAVMVAVAVVPNAIDIVAHLPVPISASLMTLVLGAMVMTALKQIRTFPHAEQYLVVLPAIVPTFVWFFVSDELTGILQMIGNPLLCGVAIAMVLDRALQNQRKRRADVTGLLGQP